jgi:hypothetical protein
MLTFFTTAKPFKGHSGIIQCNALQSWMLLDPDVEVILFGDDEGAADVAKKLSARHEPYVERNEFGTKRLDYMFRRAQAIGRHDVLCYINCDIILLPDFLKALSRVRAAHPRFLMVGRRWDTDVTEPIDFSVAGWQDRSRALAQEKGKMQPGYSVDYFAFRRGLYKDIPPLVIGRIWWDHWLVWRAREEGVAVVDISQVAISIHQNHGYSYHPEGATGVWTDEQARHNLELAGGRGHLYTIDDATHLLKPDGERVNWKRLWAPYWRTMRPKVIPAWFALLDATRPVRNALGLRRMRGASVPPRIEEKGRS